MGQQIQPITPTVPPNPNSINGLLLLNLPSNSTWLATRSEKESSVITRRTGGMLDLSGRIDFMEIQGDDLRQVEKKATRSAENIGATT